MNAAVRRLWTCPDCGVDLDLDPAGRLSGALRLVCGAPRPGRVRMRCMRPAGHAGRHEARIAHGTPRARATTWQVGPPAVRRRAAPIRRPA